MNLREGADAVIGKKTRLVQHAVEQRFHAVAAQQGK